MSFRIAYATLICWLVGVGGIAADNQSIPADFAVLHNLRYREGLSKAWVLDLAMKKDRSGKPRPGIVIIHGGGANPNAQSGQWSTVPPPIPSRTRLSPPA